MKEEVAASVKAYAWFHEKCRIHNIHYKTVVDIGCGYWYANAKLFASEESVEVIGFDPCLHPLDADYHFPGSPVKEGINRAIRSFYGAVHDILLRKASKKRWNESAIRLIPVRFEEHELESQSADLVLSIAAFEHFEDPGVIAEKIEKVLRPGGFGIFRINLFTSLTGGHNYSKQTPPWDHLRARTIPVRTYLNKWSLNQYRDLFGKHFEIVEEQLMPEPEKAKELLQPVRNELREYEDDELLSSALAIVVRSKKTVSC